MLRKISKLLGILLICTVIFFCLYSISEKVRFNAIVIHHTASAVDNYQSIAEFHRKEKGWRDAAYHLILSNGSTNVPLGFIEATSRYRYLSASVATKNMYYNLRAIHICVVGDYDKREMPDALTAALVDAVRQLQEKYRIGNDQVLFHRDCSSSSCPGRFITKEKLQLWLVSDTPKCPLSVKMQHEKVIGGDVESFGSFERKVEGFGARAFGVLKSILISWRQLA